VAGDRPLALSDSLLAVLHTPEKYVCTMVESVLELLSKIIRRSNQPGPYKGPLLESVLPTLLFVMMNSSNEDVLQVGSAAHSSGCPRVCGGSPLALGDAIRARCIYWRPDVALC